MPPVTLNARVCYPQSHVNAEQKSSDFESNSNQTWSKRRHKSSPKCRSKSSPRNSRNLQVPAPSKTPPSITYDRNFLLSLRVSPPSTLTPNLPAIPGVTVPRTKEIPLSLKLKLQKKGIEIRENTNQVIPVHTPLRSIDHVNTIDDVQTDAPACMRSRSNRSCSDLSWQSCMYHVM